MLINSNDKKSIQIIFIRFQLILINIYTKIASVFPQKLCRVLSLIGGIGLAGIYFLHNMMFVPFINGSIPFFFKYGGFIWDIFQIFCFLFLFLPVIYDARKDVQSYLIISFNKILFYPLSIFVMLFGISALSSTPGRLKLFLIYFFVFVPVSIISSKSKLFIQSIRVFLKSVICLGILYYIFAAIFVPYYGGQYPGLSINPNSLAQLSACIIVISLLLAYQAKNNSWRLFYHFVSATAISYILLSRSRTITIVVGLVYIIYIVYYCLHYCKNILKILSTLIVYFISILIITNVFMFTVKYNLNKDVPSNNMYFKIVSKLTDNTIYQNDSSLKKTDPTKLEKGDGLLSRFDPQNIKIGSQGYKEEHSELFIKLDKLTTHRWAIWNKYISETKIYGQNMRAFEVDGYNRKGSTAHNLFVQISYDTGFIGGLVYFAFTIICGIYLLIFLFRRKKSFFILFFILSTTAYLATGMGESCCYSNVYLISFLFYLGIIPFIIKDFIYSPDQDENS